MIPTDEIISMAKQCGMAPDKYGLFHNIEESEDGADLESFAALVSARAAKDERERCILDCEKVAWDWDEKKYPGHPHARKSKFVLLTEAIKAIRARGDQHEQ